MISLVIDSSTSRLYIALVDDEKVLYEKYQDGKNDHSKYIVSLIEEGLKENNLEVSSLDKVVVGIGPGSYTGVRMGITIAKMFNAFKGIKVYQISTLFLMGSSLNEKASVRIDARRGNVFGAIYDFSNNEIIKAEGLYPIDEISEYIVVEENDFTVNPVRCVLNSTLVENPDLLIPNYLRETEAERNLKWYMRRPITI